MVARGTAEWLRRQFLGGEILQTVQKVAAVVQLSPRAHDDGCRPRRRATVPQTVDTVGQDTTQQARPGEPCGTEAGSARPCSPAAGAVREAPRGAGERSERGGER